MAGQNVLPGPNVPSGIGVAKELLWGIESDQTIKQCYASETESEIWDEVPRPMACGCGSAAEVQRAIVPVVKGECSLDFRMPRNRFTLY
ncbi:MAG: hypothetical protein ACR2NN_10460 [Bryobacteraceae bacterium]